MIAFVVVFYQFLLSLDLFDCIYLTQIHTFQLSSRSGQTWSFVFNPFNKLTSAFYASVLLLIINFVITLSK